jgi:hypothetical protein
MSVEQMRSAVISAYKDSSTWCTKVADMPDKQVVAIFNRFKRERKI